MIVYPFSFFKSVGGVSPLDPDAAAFLTAIGNTDPTIESAINTMVVDLKSYGLWTKLKVIYPFVGGTATSNKYNLKDPRDLDAAFRLTYFGGITHTDGFRPNGTNGYADSFYKPASNATFNDEHITLYINTNNAMSKGDTVDIGVLPGVGGLAYSSLMGVRASEYLARFNLEVDVVSHSTVKGFYVVTKGAPNSPKYYKNGTLDLNGSSGGDGISTENIYVGNLNFNGSPYGDGYSNQNFCFVSAGTNLTSTDSSNLYSVVQACQTTLGRQN
jgi:hypothetical protein